MRTNPSAAACVLVVLAMAVGCTAAPPSRPRTPSPSPSSSPLETDVPERSPSLDALARDLDRLLRALDSTHPEPFHAISRDDFAAALDEYAEMLPGLTTDEAVVELMRRVALLSREGRDGHQFALPMPGHQGPVLPLRIYEFDEGVFIRGRASRRAGLNSWDDVNQVRLEALPVPMQVGVSTVYWQFAEPDDPRLTIEPDVALAVTADDHFARRDPVLDAALAAGS